MLGLLVLLSPGQHGFEVAIELALLQRHGEAAANERIAKVDEPYRRRVVADPEGLLKLSQVQFRIDGRLRAARRGAARRASKDLNRPGFELTPEVRRLQYS